MGISNPTAHNGLLMRIQSISAASGLALNATVTLAKADLDRGIRISCNDTKVLGWCP